MKTLLLSLLIVLLGFMDSIYALKPVIKAVIFDLDGTLLGNSLLFTHLFTHFTIH